MAGRKEYRDLTVGDIYRNGKSVPILRISGLWLEELGFRTGDFVRIKCEDGQLIISLNEEKAQQVAEEKAFMEGGIMFALIGINLPSLMKYSFFLYLEATDEGEYFE